MSIEIDETCKSIILSLSDEAKNYAALQRAINAGSQKTAKNHVKKHLVPGNLVKVLKKRQGLQTYYSIELTKKGKQLCKVLR